MKYLKAKQILYQLYYRFYKPKTVVDGRLPLRDTVNIFIKSIDKKNAIVQRHRATFLNQTYDISSQNIWNDKNKEKLWLYNLHYFDCLQNSIFQQGKSFIDRWIIENSITDGNGWEPYPLSLRIVNWIKWSLQGRQLANMQLESLVQQTRMLGKKLEYHIMANHLFANAKALVFSGLFFTGSEAEKWFDKGHRLLLEQVSEQILSDGGHFELSPMYHAIILEDMLDIINVYQVYNRSVPDKWIQVIKKMFRWLKIMSHPDGEIALFNDAAFKIASKYDVLLAYANRLQISIIYPKLESIEYLSASGYIRVQTKNIYLLIDVANFQPMYQPGHSHADTLTYEFSYRGKRVIVNSGTSCYAVSKERLRQRGTAAHNAIIVDNKNSSEVWSGFRVARRASINDVKIMQNNGSIDIRAMHDGYIKLKGNVIQCRRWLILENQLSVVDTIIGRCQHLIVNNMYFSPNFFIQQDSVKEKFIVKSEANEIRVESNFPFSLIDSKYHPEFGLSIKNSLLQQEIVTRLPCELKTTFILE